MMLRSTLLICASMIALAGCSENPQTAGGAKQDTSPYAGTGKPYVETNWKQGDKTSWESALRARTQNGQNDYTRAN
jgi:hypothetical protein